MTYYHVHYSYINSKFHSVHFEFNYNIASPCHTGHKLCQDDDKGEENNLIHADTDETSEGILHLNELSRTLFTKFILVNYGPDDNPPQLF